MNRINFSSPFPTFSKFSNERTPLQSNLLNSKLITLPEIQNENIFTLESQQISNNKCKEPKRKINQNLMNANIITNNSKKNKNNPSSFLQFLENPKNQLTIQNSGFLNNIFNPNQLLSNKLRENVAEVEESKEGLKQPQKSIFELNYEILKSLGRGEHGEVFKVVDRRDRQIYAVKQLKGNADQFRAEIVKISRISNLVSSTNIIKYNYSFFENNTWNIIMEYCKMNLREKFNLWKRKKVKIEKINLLRLIKHVAKGLHKLHKNGISHLDLKPENILIAKIRGKEKYKIGDMGHAQFTEFFSSGTRFNRTKNPSAFINNSVISNEKLFLNLVIEETHEDGELNLLKENKSQELDTGGFLRNFHLRGEDARRNKRDPLPSVRTPDMSSKIFTSMTCPRNDTQSVIHPRPSAFFQSEELRNPEPSEKKSPIRSIFLKSGGNIKLALSSKNNQNSIQRNLSVVSEKPKIKSVSHTIKVNNSTNTLQSHLKDFSQNRWVTPSQQRGSRLSFQSDNVTQMYLDRQIKKFRHILETGDSRYVAKELFKFMGRSINRKGAKQSKRKLSMNQSRRMKNNFQGDGLMNASWSELNNIDSVITLTPEQMRSSKKPHVSNRERDDWANVPLIRNKGVVSSNLDNFMNESGSLIPESSISELSFDLGLIHKADIFSFGLILMEVINITKEFKLPKNGTLWKSLRDEPEFFINLLDCDAEIKDLLFKMLHKNPEKRISAKSIVKFVRKLKKSISPSTNKSIEETQISEFRLKNLGSEKNVFKSVKSSAKDKRKISSVWSNENKFLFKKQNNQLIEKKLEKEILNIERQNNIIQSRNNMFNSCTFVENNNSLKKKKEIKDKEIFLEKASKEMNQKIKNENITKSEKIWNSLNSKPLMNKFSKIIFKSKKKNFAFPSPNKETNKKQYKKKMGIKKNTLVNLEEVLSKKSDDLMFDYTAPEVKKNKLAIINPNTISFKDDNSKIDHPEIIKCDAKKINDKSDNIFQAINPYTNISCNKTGNQKTNKFKRIKIKNNTICFDDDPEEQKQDPKETIKENSFDRLIVSMPNNNVPNERNIFNSNIINFKKFFSEESRSIASSFDMNQFSKNIRMTHLKNKVSNQSKTEMKSIEPSKNKIEKIKQKIIFKSNRKKSLLKRRKLNRPFLSKFSTLKKTIPRQKVIKNNSVQFNRSKIKLGQNKLKKSEFINLKKKFSFMSKDSEKLEKPNFDESKAHNFTFNENDFNLVSKKSKKSLVKSTMISNDLLNPKQDIKKKSEKNFSKRKLSKLKIRGNQSSIFHSLQNSKDLIKNKELLKKIINRFK